MNKLLSPNICKLYLYLQSGWFKYLNIIFIYLEF